MNNPSIRFESESPEISVSVRAGLLPVAILSVALVAVFLMLSHAIGKLPAEIIQVNPTPVTINPAPVEVRVRATVRPKIIIKQVVAGKEPIHVSAYDTEITVVPPADAKHPIIPNSLKKSANAFSLGFAAEQVSR